LGNPLTLSFRERAQALRPRLRELYNGYSQQAVRFRSLMLVFDLALLAFFIVSPFLERSNQAQFVDYAIGTVLAIDLAVRGWAYYSFRSWIRRPIVWVDLVVLASLLAPMLFANFAFLRILRALTLVRSDGFWRTMRRGRWAETRVQEIVIAATNLVVFVFVMTGFVHSTFAAHLPTINSYVDSLYFTVATLTTTGFGDITLPGTWGRILSIFMMLSGVSLFVRLAQVMLRPAKVSYPCPACGLRRHDPDAVHCKACGRLLTIPDDND
jgi:voltage-gated potassium channel